MDVKVTKDQLNIDSEVVSTFISTRSGEEPHDTIDKANDAPPQGNRFCGGPVSAAVGIDQAFKELLKETLRCMRRDLLAAGLVDLDSTVLIQ